MNHRHFIASVAFAALVAGGAHASTNLVTNGSFETGDFTGWTQWGDTSFTGVASGCYDNGCPTDGSNLAYFGSVDNFGGISQTINTSGVTTVSFDISNDNGNGYYVDLGSTELVSEGTVGSYGVTHESFTVTSNGPQTLTFGFYNVPAYYTLDNVVVTSAVPEPAAWAGMILGLGLAGAALRRRKAVAAV